jgi:hypothetical protein
MPYHTGHTLERRENPRAYVELLTFINPVHKKPYIISGWIHNMSHGGVGVKARIPSSFNEILYKGDKVELTTYEEFFKFHGTGKVVWTSALGVIAGIKLSHLSEQSQGALELLLKLFGFASFGGH